MSADQWKMKKGFLFEKTEVFVVKTHRIILKLYKKFQGFENMVLKCI